MLDKKKLLIAQLFAGDYKSLARVLTIIENDLADANFILKSLKTKQIPVIGITGPPGAGKSTLLNALLGELSAKYKIAVLAIDPTSPFSKGALLGDRIRMMDQFNQAHVFIRSLASRGSLGGLSSKTIEMLDVLKASNFDYIFVETVGVGQSEVEIATLADISVVVLVPEAGDEIQSIKSGLMEIADVFVVNKSDREGAETFANHLKMMINHQNKAVNIIKTVANRGDGIAELLIEIQNFDIKNHYCPIKPKDEFHNVISH